VTWHTKILPISPHPRGLYLSITLPAPVQRLLEIYLFTWPLWSQHSTSPGHDIHLIIFHYNHTTTSFPINITKPVILTVGWIPSKWFATHRYDIPVGPCSGIVMCFLWGTN
jgi:hypothetical protein